MPTPYKDASLIASTSLISTYLVALNSLRGFLESATDTDIQEFETLRYLLADHRDDLEIPLVNIEQRIEDVADRLENREYA